MTISGGEPLMQPDFTADILRLCKEAYINTAVETCGFAGKSAIDRVFPHVDLFLLRLKTYGQRDAHEINGCSERGHS